MSPLSSQTFMTGKKSIFLKRDATPDEILNGTASNDNSLEVCESILNARVIFNIDPSRRKPLPIIPNYVTHISIIQVRRDAGFRRAGGPMIITNPKGTKVSMPLWTPFLSLILKNETPAIAYPFAKAMTAIRQLLNIPNQKVYIPTEEEQKRIYTEDVDNLNSTSISRQQPSIVPPGNGIRPSSDTQGYNNNYKLPPVVPNSKIGRQPQYVQDMARAGMNVNTGDIWSPKSASRQQINEFQQQ